MSENIPNWPEMVSKWLFDPNWSEIVQRSPNLMTNPLKGKKNGCNLWKNGYLTPKTLFQQGFGGQIPIISPVMSNYFYRVVGKSNNESNQCKKSGCHPWKNGHLTPKKVKIGLDNWLRAVIPTGMVRNNLGQSLICCEVIQNHSKWLKKMSKISQIGQKWSQNGCV